MFKWNINKKGSDSFLDYIIDLLTKIQILDLFTIDIKFVKEFSLLLY